MCHFKNKNSKIFSPERPRENVFPAYGGPGFVVFLFVAFWCLLLAYNSGHFIKLTETGLISFLFHQYLYCATVQTSYKKAFLKHFY